MFLSRRFHLLSLTGDLGFEPLTVDGPGPLHPHPLGQFTRSESDLWFEGI